MKKVVAAGIAAIILLSSAIATARELSAAEKKIISDVALTQLKDPDSAKFYWQDYKGGSGLCAHVNAKNSYGGYTGKELMIVSVKKDKNDKIISADVWIHSGEMAEIMKPTCIESGYSV